MAAINTGSFALDLKPLVHDWFGLAYPEFGKEHEDIFEILASGDAYEEDALFSGLGLGKKILEGAAVEYDSMSQNWSVRYTHIKYGLGFIVTEEALDDGKVLKLARDGSMHLKKSLMHVKETVAANILNRAFNSSYTGGDGKELCARDHATKANDLANEPATAADLSEAALEQAMIDIGDFRDDRGLRVKVLPRRLIIPKEEQFNAVRILKSDLRPGVADNDINAVRNVGVVPDGPRLNHYLTDVDAWFLMTDAEKGLRLFNRKDLAIKSDNDFDTENAKFKAAMRFSAGWTDPRGIYGSPGA